MAMMTLAQVQALLPGSQLVGDGSLVIERVHSDSRSLRAGDLFVALRGERFDAHDFMPHARDAGAVAALAERGLSAVAGGLPGVQVSNSLLALQQLAASWRAHLHLPLIAVTGSNGKTTVTQMVAAILRAWLNQPASAGAPDCDAALATAGNFNNHIGVPLTLLRLRQDDSHWHRAAVLELGMNHPGEIALLARWAQPSVVLVNNAQREHQEFMHGLQAVAEENGQAIHALGAAGTVVLPAADAFTPLWRQMAGTRKVLTFALALPAEVSADITAEATWLTDQKHWQLTLHTPAGSAATTLHLPGRHNVLNALAASACALAVGAPLNAVVQGLAAFKPVAGRSQVHSLRWAGQAVTLIDDSYNANPDSVLAAIDTLASLPGPHWLVLGDMGEVGSQGAAFHAEVGAHARALGIAHVWAVGALSIHVGAQRHFDNVASMLLALKNTAPAAHSVLVKGSRFMQMERVVKSLQEHLQPGATDAA